MGTTISLWQVFFVALITDFATGLGALPLGFVRATSEKRQGFMTAVAAGMMLSASLFGLAHQGLHRGAAWEVVLGMLLGALFLQFAAQHAGEHDFHMAHLQGAEARRSLLIVLAMFIHSIPEGIAIGVGYATGENRFGLLLAISIAAQNIPEGTAVALPLLARGVPLWVCVGYAVFTSLPQPLAAVPSFLLVSWFQPILPVALGFAGGAMIFLVLIDMWPDSLARCGPKISAWGITLGLCAMLWLTQILET